MRVFLEDGTMKTLQVPIPCAVHELVDLMKQKQKLTDVSEYGIYEFHDKTGTLFGFFFSSVQSFPPPITPPGP